MNVCNAHPQEETGEALLLFLGDYSTPRPKSAKIYWLVTKEPAGSFRVKSLNDRNLPAGVCRQLPEDEFMVAFTPEPAHFQKFTFPALIRYLEENKAKPEVLDQLKEIGLTAGGHEFTDQEVDRIIRYLHERSASLAYDQSRELSLYSVKLRKLKRYADALTYCRKAYEVNPADENIYFNMARVYLEMKEPDRARQCVDQALALNPVFEPARKFKRYLDKAASQ